MKWTTCEDRALDVAMKTFASAVPSFAADVGTWAVARSLLPVYGDVGGYLLLGKGGVVYEVGADERQPVVVDDERRRAIALLAASERFAELAHLRPKRPMDGVTCDACGGGGRLLGLARCSACLGLGWLARGT